MLHSLCLLLSPFLNHLAFKLLTSTFGLYAFLVGAAKFVRRWDGKLKEVADEFNELLAVRADYGARQIVAVFRTVDSSRIAWIPVGGK